MFDSRSSKSQTIPILKIKFQLLWIARLSPTHTRLSFNILREVCSYLGQELLIAVLKTEVQLFSVPSLQKLHRFPLKPGISVDDRSSATFIEDKKVFVCGGCSYNTAYVVLEDGSFSQQPNMQVARAGPGIIYIEALRTVLVFGGTRGRLNLLKSSESFSFSTSQWEQIPDMQNPRAYFNPCLLSNVVYLCGGLTSSVETYDLRTKTLKLIPEFSLPENRISLAVVTSGDIVVVSDHYICRWKSQELRVLRREYSSEVFLWSNCVPVVCGRAVYALYLREWSCGSINLETGADEKVINFT